jgi:hypothetical protein
VVLWWSIWSFVCGEALGGGASAMAACVAACAANGVFLGVQRESVGAWSAPTPGVVALLARGEGIERRKGVRIGVRYGGRRVAVGGRRWSGVSRARVQLEEEWAGEVERDEEGRLWSPTPEAAKAYESTKYENGAALVVDNGVSKVAADGSIESTNVKAASNGAARESNGAAVATGNGSVATNGYSNGNGAANGAANGAVNGAANGSSRLPTNGAARAAIDAVKDVKVYSKVESIEQEDPWFKKANTQNVKVCDYFP